MTEPSGGGGWIAEHWDGIIGGGAAGVMLLRELYRLWTDRAKIAADTARDHRAEGEGLVSQALAILLGASRADLVSQSWRDRVVPGDLSATMAIEARALGEPVQIENSYRTGPNADGPPVRLRWWAARYAKGGVSVAHAEPVEG